MSFLEYSVDGALQILALEDRNLISNVMNCHCHTVLIEEETVEEKHAFIEIMNDQIILYSIFSSTHLKKNGHHEFSAVEPMTGCVIEDGDEIKFGNISTRLRLSSSNDHILVPETEDIQNLSVDLTENVNFVASDVVDIPETEVFDPENCKISLEDQHRGKSDYLIDDTIEKRSCVSENDENVENVSSMSEEESLELTALQEEYILQYSNQMFKAPLPPLVPLSLRENKENKMELETQALALPVATRNFMKRQNNLKPKTVPTSEFDDTQVPIKKRKVQNFQTEDFMQETQPIDVLSTQLLQNMKNSQNRILMSDDEDEESDTLLGNEISLKAPPCNNVLKESSQDESLSFQIFRQSDTQQNIFLNEINSSQESQNPILEFNDLTQNETQLFVCDESIISNENDILKVLVSSNFDQKLLQTCREKLGVEIVDDYKDAQVYVVKSNKLSCVSKCLTSICKGIPIVGEDFLKESISSQRWLDPNDFIVKDEELEADKQFKLQESLQKAKKQSLFGDSLTFITSKVSDKIFGDIKMVAEAGGSKVVSSIDQLINSQNKKVFIIHNKDVPKEIANYSNKVEIYYKPFHKVVLRQSYDFLLEE